MPFFDVRIEGFRFAIAHRLDEIGKVISFLLGCWARFFLLPQKSAIHSIAGDFHVALGAEEEDPDDVGISLVFADTSFRIGNPVADFKGQELLFLWVLKGADLGVRSFLVVIK